MRYQGVLHTTKLVENSTISFLETVEGEGIADSVNKFQKNKKAVDKNDS